MKYSNHVLGAVKQSDKNRSADNWTSLTSEINLALGVTRENCHVAAVGIFTNRSGAADLKKDRYENLIFM